MSARGTLDLPAISVRAAWLIGIAIAAVIVIGASGGDIHRTAEGDGLIYRYVALNLDIETEDVHPVVVERGTSLRYGRIGLPGMMWLLAFGQTVVIPYAHALIMIITAGAAAAAVTALFPRAGPLGLMVTFLSPGFPLSLAGGFAEVPALAFALWGIVFAARARWLPAIALLSIAILTKESMVLIAIGVGLCLLARRSIGPAVALTAALIPVGTWYLVVRSKHGHIPILDPYLDDFDGHAGTPIWALIRSFSDPPSTPGLVTAVGHTLVALIAWMAARTSLLGTVAAVTTVQLLTAGPFAWEFIGEAVRVFLPMQLLTVLAVVAWRRPGFVADGLRPLPVPS